MSVEAIGAIALSALAQPETIRTDAIAPTANAGIKGADFMNVMGAGLSRADQSLRSADTQLRALAAGQDIPIHEVMIAMEQARMDLTLVVEVRNRMLESYQELTRMQL
ncbi:flagellar hook-basal body complex protein FliE [Lysobacter capsici]|jgi:flagellar hook-basal body complex protein FliE|uniref:Flagellar hook-basal body complex protein FliE n=1 Tax=Lysobacter capsici AZ78 TaxID=1444315 RepID=A0A108U7N0_9GAMM|nr:flagellar hook-basal body complex protein FliE [Lysobacter capsici]ALN84760.1 flagellar hook-basal body complex protein FliE [Lysobacter capsici]ATE71082.1 flagellar hook-basal body complex protein FliE [Lysobacter capsici]KWS04075.1 Flagellar hook-basal body complex protein FliE [Lysobacter capsici AZ78]UOF16291.1 flagellar hook-basal body complex protein FliE [Lysobacter capsici]WND82033.1 flagellar hook-basal body complex protein FliE [Lysobacter capsici]